MFQRLLFEYFDGNMELITVEVLKIFLHETTGNKQTTMTYIGVHIIYE